MDKRALDIAQWELWSEFTDKMDNLHREATRLDQTGKLGYIYLAEMQIAGQDNIDHGHIKIGRAVNPSFRIRQWSKTHVTMPYQIHQLHSFWSEDAPLTERYLHRLFQRHREAGEWFWLPWEVQHSLMGIWYVDVYGENADKMFWRDHGGSWREPLAFIRNDIREQRELARYQREARERRRTQENEAR